MRVFLFFASRFERKSKQKIVVGYLFVTEIDPPAHSCCATVLRYVLEYPTGTRRVAQTYSQPVKALQAIGYRIKAIGYRLLSTWYQISAIGSTLYAVGYHV